MYMYNIENNSIVDVMVSVHALILVDREFDPGQDQTKAIKLVFAAFRYGRSFKEKGHRLVGSESG